jgi:hypothetical protein
VIMIMIMDIVTINDQVIGSEYHNDSVKFDYELNSKGAKSKLLKGSKRKPIEVEKNSTSINLIFSVGSWLTCVLPAIRYWNENQGDKSCKVGDHAIKVGGIKSGKDANGMHVVSKVVFYFEKSGSRHDKIVCHLYNTTQLILVNGHGYQEFINVFLMPLFEAKISACTQEIQKLNDEVSQKFGAKTVKRSSVKYKRRVSFPLQSM